MLNSMRSVSVSRGIARSSGFSTNCVLWPQIESCFHGELAQLAFSDLLQRLAQ